MTITIRPATADAPDLIRLNAENNDVRCTVADLQQRLQIRHAAEQALLAESNSRVIGYLCLRLLPQICDSAPYAEVSELYVEAAHRRQGAAQALMAWAVELARAAGAKELILMTGFRNSTAQQFYLKQGFTNYCLALRKPLLDDSVIG
jgi:GNAT superfamily N-acetyltransferase